MGSNREILSEASGGEEVDHIEVTVQPQASCTSYIADPTISLTITDTMPATHTGSIAVTVAPVGSRTDCTASAQVTVPLGSQSTSRAGTTFPANPQPKLVDNPVGTGPAGTNEACSYTATFASPLTIGLGQTALTLERDSDAAATAPLNATTTTASSSYDVVRDAVFMIDNVSTAHAPVVKANRTNVIVTVAAGAGCTATAPTGITSPFTPTTAAEEVNFGQAAAAEGCAWEVSYNNPDRDCKVTFAVKDPTGQPLSFTDVNPNDNKLTVYTFGRRVRVANSATAAVIGSVEFAVPDPGVTNSGGDCTTYFDGAVTLDHYRHRAGDLLGFVDAAADSADWAQRLHARQGCAGAVEQGGFTSRCDIPGDDR